MSHALVIIQHAAIQRGITFKILAGLEKRQLALCAIKSMNLTQEQVGKFYRKEPERPYNPGLNELMLGEAVIAMYHGKEEFVIETLYRCIGGDYLHHIGTVMENFTGSYWDLQKLVTIGGEKRISIFFRPSEHVGCKIGS